MKEMLKKYKLIYFFIRQVRSLQFFIIPDIMFNIKKWLRVNHIYKNSPYEKLKMFQNQYEGKRCFIVATGPSLTIKDLNQLKDEITFSMNSICMAFDETEWRPTFYGIQDRAVFNKFEETIKKMDVRYKFIADKISKQTNLSDDFFIFPLNLLNHEVFHQKRKTKFSHDVFAVVYDGYSITYSLIQLAVYMGFKEIYLLGADSNYSQHNGYHFKDYGIVDQTFSSIGEQMISAYKVAKQFADKHQIKIYNATRGGMLEVFERVELEQVLAEKKCSDVVG